MIFYYVVFFINNLFWILFLGVNIHILTLVLMFSFYPKIL